jgi:hypothetical protein
MVPGEYDYLVTVTEFYEFMLPYLFLSNAITEKPIELPNFLLAAALSQNLNQSLDLETLVGDFLASREDERVKSDYTILARLSNEKRYQEIRERCAAVERISDEEQLEERQEQYLRDATGAVEQYKAEIRQSLQGSIVKERLNRQERLIEEQRKKIEELEQNQKKFEEKEKGRQKYLRRQKRRENVKKS